MADAFGRREENELDERMNPKKEPRRNAYQKHFEDYVTRRVLRPDGKTVTERVYVGDYYRHAMSDRSWRGMKAVYLVLFAISAVLFAFESTRFLPSNSTRYCAVIQLVCVILLIRLLFLLIVYVTAPRRLTVGEYKYSIQPLKKAALQTAIALAAVVPAVLISAAVRKNPAELPGALLSALSTGAMYLLYRLESGNRYEREANKNEQVVNEPGAKRV